MVRGSSKYGLPVGVRPWRNGGFEARVYIGGRYHYVGRFQSVMEAAATVRQIEERHPARLRRSGRGYGIWKRKSRNTFELYRYRPSLPRERIGSYSTRWKAEQAAKKLIGDL